MPLPGVADDIRELTALRIPAQFTTGLLGGRHEHRRVPGSPGTEVDFDVATGDRRARAHDLQVRVAATVAEVEHATRAARRERLEREAMSVREIEHVDVVAHAGAVRSRIVVTEHLETGLPVGHRHQDPRDEMGLGVVCLPHRAIGPGAGDVEVAEADRAGPGIASAAFQKLFERELARPVRVHGQCAGILFDGY